MKNIVVNDEYHQSDLKPSDLLQQYLNLLHKDVADLLAKKHLMKVNCPACDCAQSTKYFKKLGLTYNACAECNSLYVAERPSDSEVVHFYREAASKKFWRNQLSEASRHQRKDKIIKPRFEWIADSTAEYLPQAKHWVDLHTSQRRYLEALATVSLSQKTIVYPFCETSSVQGVEIIEKPWWEAAVANADIVTLFEVIDHTSDVSALLKRVHEMLKDGGLCFITSILGSGLDVKELGEHAPNIYPPERLNVLTVQGFKKLFSRHGFECLEFSTPGILDVEIVATALRENPALPISPFIRSIVLNSVEQVRHSFQEFLQANVLSSYGRILIRKV